MCQKNTYETNFRISTLCPLQKCVVHCIKQQDVFTKRHFQENEQMQSQNRLRISCIKIVSLVISCHYTRQIPAAHIQAKSITKTSPFQNHTMRLNYLFMKWFLMKAICTFYHQLKWQEGFRDIQQNQPIHVSLEQYWFSVSCKTELTRHPNTMMNCTTTFQHLPKRNVLTSLWAVLFCLECTDIA